MNLKKMYAVVIFKILIMLVIIIATMITFTFIMAQSRVLQQEGTELVEHANTILHNNNHLVKLIRLYIIRQDPAVLREYEAMINDYNSLDGKLDAMMAIGLSDSELQLVDQMMDQLYVLGEIEDRALEALDAGDHETAYIIIYSDEYNQADNRITTYTESLIKEITDRNARVFLKNRQSSQNLMVIIGTVLFIALCSVIAMQLILRRRVLKPIGALKKLMGDVSVGKFNANRAEVSNDEIGDFTSEGYDRRD